MNVGSGRQRNKKGPDRVELQEVRADKEQLLEQLVVLTEKERKLSLKTKGIVWVYLDDKKKRPRSA